MATWTWHFYANFDIPNDFHYRVLFKEDYSILVRRNHPLMNQARGITEEQLSKWPRAEILYPSTTMMNIDDVITPNAASEQSAVNDLFTLFFGYRAADTNYGYDCRIAHTYLYAC